MKKHYLTVTMISGAVVQSNNRAESQGNLTCLQEISLGNQQFSAINGEPIRYASRVGLTDFYGEDRMFRVTGKTDTNSGYGYGNTHTSGSIEKGVEEVGDLEALKKKVDVALFGMMSAVKGKGKDPIKLRSVVEVSRAISCTPFEGTTLFTQGVNGSTGGIVPTHQQVHGTRYMYHITLDLDMLEADVFEALFEILFGGLKVGGNHARNAMTLIPDAAVWSFYNVAGNNRLYTVGMLFPPEKPIDLTEYKALLTDRGMTEGDPASAVQPKAFYASGVGQAFTTKVGQTVGILCRQAAQFKQS